MRYVTFVFADEQFGSDYIGFKRVSGDRIYIKVTIAINETGVDETYLAKSQKLYLASFGTIKLEHDIENNSLVPARYKLAVKDINGVLKYYLYDYPNYYNINKEFYVQIFIKYANSSTYIEEFSGYAVLDTLFYDKDAKEHTCDVLPQTDKLNSELVLDVGYDATRLDYSYVPKNPLNLPTTWLAFPDHVVFTWTPIKLVDIINKIFWHVNPACSVTIINNMKFVGFNSNTGSISDFTFNDLYALTSWIGSIFAEDKHSSIKTLGDVLKILAFEFLSIAGFTTSNKAFFRPIIFNDNNPQPMGKLLYGSHNRKYKYSKKDGLRLKAVLYNQDTNKTNRYVETASLELTNKTNDNVIERELVTIMGLDALNNPVSNIMVKYTLAGTEYALDVYKAQHDFVGLGAGRAGGLTTLISKFYNYFFSYLENKDIREFIYLGLQYDYNRTFVYQNDIYNILSMEKDLDKGTTYIEAIKVVDRTYEEDTITLTPTTNPLNAETQYMYGAVVDFTQDSFGTSGNEFFAGIINKNEILDSIEWAITEEFEGDKIDTLRLYEKNSGITLVTQNDIDFSEKNVTSMKFLKRYNADEYFYLQLIPKPGQTLTRGKGNIVLKKLRREF